MCGLWAILAEGIFDLKVGLIYTGSFAQLRIQCIGALAYFVWSSLLSWIFFNALRANDRLRVNPIFECVGLDLIPTTRERSIEYNYLAEMMKKDA